MSIENALYYAETAALLQSAAPSTDLLHRASPNDGGRGARTGQWPLGACVYLEKESTP